MVKKKMWDRVAYILAGLGALNWGLVSLFNMNLVDFIPQFGQYVYIAIGAAGGYILFMEVQK